VTAKQASTRGRSTVRRHSTLLNPAQRESNSAEGSLPGASSLLLLSPPCRHRAVWDCETGVGLRRPGRVQVAQALKFIPDTVRAWIQSSALRPSYHLHQYIVDERYFGDPNPEFTDELTPMTDERDATLGDIVEVKEIVYEYDFGDSWRHVIEIENLGIEAALRDLLRDVLRDELRHLRDEMFEAVRAAVRADDQPPPGNDPDPDELLTVGQVAHRIQVIPDTVRTLDPVACA
jgi:hypothetical protein